jgi:NADH-quinone oxidoreductase subunit J
MGLLGARVDQLDEPDSTVRQGMSGYLLPFEIISVHLLVVLVGSAYLGRPKKRVSAAVDRSDS